MTSATTFPSGDGVSKPEFQPNGHRATYIRANILRDHIARAERRIPSAVTPAIPRLTLSAALHHLETSTSPHGVGADDNARLPGGLSRDNLLQLSGMTPTPQDDPDFCAALEEQLLQTLLQITAYYHSDSPSPLGDDPEARAQLPRQIRARRAELAQQDVTLREARARVVQLVGQIAEIHPRLEAKLLSALTALPPSLNATRAAHADVHAATIETALLKLSLLRARAHAALYGHTSESGATVAQAVAAAHGQLRERQKAQEAERAALDAQLAAYEHTLGIVGGSGYAQVVDDMARVKRETDECRRDLRRLGWTGD